MSKTTLSNRNPSTKKPGHGCPVKQSASKGDFLEAIGLRMEIAEDRRLMDEIWDDIVQCWRATFDGPKRAQILKPEYERNKNVKPPYKWAHLDPDFIEHLISQISAEVGSLRELPVIRQGLHKEQESRWIIRWLLWHACRYRDWRNHKAKPTPPKFATPLAYGQQSHLPDRTRPREDKESPGLGVLGKFGRDKGQPSPGMASKLIPWSTLIRELKDELLTDSLRDGAPAREYTELLEHSNELIMANPSL